MLRVLFDGRVLNDHFPGIGRYAFHLLEALVARDDVHITLLLNPNSVNTRFALASLPVRTLFFPFSPFHIFGQLAMVHLLRRYQQAAFDLYHAPYYIYPYLLSMPVVVTAYDTIPHRVPDAFSPARRLLIRCLKTVAFRRAQHVLAISRCTAADLERFYGVPAERITVTPLAPAPHFRPLPDSAQEAFRRRYGLPLRYGVYVGSAKGHKNLPFLFKVWESFARTVGDEPPCLVIVGPEGKHAVLPPGIRYLGFLPEAELPSLYAAARVFLFPSRWEGFGLPPLEAMACGTPVLCSDIPPLQETVGDGGQLLPLHDVTPWVDALHALWFKDAERAFWRARALRRAQSFSWTHTAERTVAGYRAAKSS